MPTTLLANKPKTELLSSVANPPITPVVASPKIIPDATGTGRTEYNADGTSTHFQGALQASPTPAPAPVLGLTPGQQADLSAKGYSVPAPKLPTPTPTIDSEAAKVSQPGTIQPPPAPATITSLPQDEQAARDAALKGKIDSLTNASLAEVNKIKLIGKQNIGASKGFLAKVGALGRTVSGAPVETGLGVLSRIQDQTNLAVREEQENLDRAIAGANADEQIAIKANITELNKLQQTNFENALKLYQASKDDYISTPEGIFNKTTGKIVIAAPVKLDTKIVEVGGRKLLINMQTNETMRDLGAVGDNNADVIKQYPDAGILPTDDASAIQLKLKSSEKYKKETQQEKWSEPYKLGGDYVQKNSLTGEIRTAVNVAAGGGTNEISNKPIQLSADDRQALLGSGLSQPEVNAIEKDVNEFGLSKVLEGISDTKQKEALQKAYGQTAEEKKFLSKDYLAGLFTEDQLKTAAKAAGFRGVLTNWESEKEKYLTSLETSINQYRLAGYTDKEILALMK